MSDSDPPPPAARPAASFVIPTRNRKDILLRCVASALAQIVPGGVEVLVFDDGSTDGTQAALAERFPPAEYPNLRCERSPGTGGRGPCVLRNLGTRLARADVVFPIDDDSILTTPHVVAQVLAEFTDNRIAVVAIPMLNVNTPGQGELQRAPDPATVSVIGEFIGAAHALRRTAFLAVGGYREHLFQYGEEGDLALRLLDRGLVVRTSNADPIHHHESQSRNLARWHRLGPCNNILLTYLNVPLPHVLLHLPATTLNAVRLGHRSGDLKNALLGILQGYGQIFARLTARRPVRTSTYRLFRALRKTRGTPLATLGLRPPR